ncbi:hypothetical protein NQ317_010976 [Molorchus minor]|uniref:THAP-type domain-containing protein n=1 Tax=Molorchus minor TaxID=1323400 RepID=A0ABQ9J4A0_9CUCU|nr:hypothetical protein NQ317_010976 [Molorchus minor]
MVMCFAPTYTNERRKWIKLIRRKDREPSKYSRICSCHFASGDRRNGPTIFSYNVGKRFESTEQKIKRKKITQVAESEAGPSGLQQIVTPADKEAPGDEAMTSTQLNTSQPLTPEKISGIGC